MSSAKVTKEGLPETRGRAREELLGRMVFICKAFCEEITVN